MSRCVRSMLPIGCHAHEPFATLTGMLPCESVIASTTLDAFARLKCACASAVIVVVVASGCVVVTIPSVPPVAIASSCKRRQSDSMTPAGTDCQSGRAACGGGGAVAHE